MGYLIFAIRLYRRKITTILIVLLLRILGFEVRVEPPDPNESPKEIERFIKAFDKVAKGIIFWGKKKYS